MINNRYQLLEKLGQGGMGVVHRAYDRLTGETIALKQVWIPSNELEFISRPDSITDRNLRVALAQEFQILASLRHPNIISVLDYGFDSKKTPFFTMTYLPEAQTILEAGKTLNTADKIDLIRQSLQALAYLHRQRILHCDLKPQNVLVSEGRVRVLDFGLSIHQGIEPATTVGSLLYMAPELLRRESPSEASDLYAVGVIAYELFAGHHPFDVTSGDFAKQVQQKSPELECLGVDEMLTKVIGCLLAKRVEDRYKSAGACLDALNTATGLVTEKENPAIRESYLQAATFVGRETEQQQLTNLLRQARKGQEQAILIGGESGVGKSRLVNQVQTQALVDGFMVLKGQGVREGGLPYQLWREPIRHLCLTVELSPLNASTLHPLVPDLPKLLDRPIEPPPKLAGDQVQQRLFLAIIHLFRQQTRPILLILEDLHWAEESLDLLQWLLRNMREIPMLVMATYRVEQQFNLPEQFPKMAHIHLERLLDKDVQKLCIHMLGIENITETLVDFLQRQSEGNTFFLIEVVRALAQQAGHLGIVGKIQLPETVFPSGIESIINERLARLPETVKSLLRLAALNGRQLDLPLLKLLVDEQALLEQVWLPTLGESGILSVERTVWQFSHDKFREGIVKQLDTNTTITLHRQIAEGLEKLYPDTPGRAADLMRHWGGAGDIEKERVYAKQAGQYAQSQNAHQDALRYWNRAEQLVDKDEIVERYEVYLAQESIYHRQGERVAQRTKLNQLSELDNLLDGKAQAELALRKAHFAIVTSDYQQAITYAKQTIALGEQLGEETLIIAGYSQLGEVLRCMGEYEQAKNHFHTGLKLAQSLQQTADMAKCFSGLAGVLIDQGDYAIAQQYANQALAIQQEIGDRKGESKTLSNLGRADYFQSKIDEAQQHFLQALVIQQEIGDRKGAGDTLNNLGVISIVRREYNLAQQYYSRALIFRQEIEDRRGEAIALNNLGVIASFTGDYVKAQQIFNLVLTIYQEIGDRRGEGLTLYNLGVVLAYQGYYNRAQCYLNDALAIRQEIGDRRGEGQTLSNLGDVLAYQGYYNRAQRYLNDALAILQKFSDRKGEGNTLSRLGWVHLMEGRLTEAEAAYQQAFSILQELNQPQFLVAVQAGLALVKSTQGDLAKSQELVSSVISYFNEDPMLAGAERKMFIFYAIWVTLTDLGRVAEAKHVLSLAAQVLQDYLDKQLDSIKREMYLAQPYHQKLWQAWRTRRQE